LEVLLLGGDPTVLPEDMLKDICDLIHSYDFKAIISTNGILKKKIINLIPYFDSIQITVNTDEEIDFYRNYADKINVKLAGDETLTIEKFNHFIEYTKDFSRRSISMYFTPDFKELCTDKEINDILNSLDWYRNGSYEYTFYKGVRIKRCIHGETNIVDEPTVPKVYPNGNYNKTWCNEDMDNYLEV
jgi:organic radical activating enzyme